MILSYVGSDCNGNISLSFIKRNRRWDKFGHMLSADMWCRQFNNKIFSYLVFGYHRKKTILINQEMCFSSLVSRPSHCLDGK